jgi:cyclic pyranopterin phosphate synthase
MILDRHARPLGTLRLSVTDRCNLRCRYCMPEDEYVWLPSESILSQAELVRLARVFVGLGAREVRITGGEPLLRHDLEAIVEGIARVEGLADLALTTNGVLLADRAEALARAGLHRITVSLDTLRPERAHALSRTTRLDDVLRGLRAVERAGLSGTKINAVIVRGVNDDELGDLLELGRSHRVEVRFIEYMDVGGATRWTPADVVSRAEILKAVEERFGPAQPIDPRGSLAPAARFRLPDGTVFGVVASTTAPFCASCDRSRVTADGVWLPCLYAENGENLRAPLLEGASDDALAELIRRRWAARVDHGAEERLRVPMREPLVQISRLRADPHREMHTRGG